MRRLISRVERLKMMAYAKSVRARGRNEQPSFAVEDKLVAPLGSFRSDGRFRWSDIMWNEIQTLGLTKFASACEEGSTGDGVEGDRS